MRLYIERDSSTLPVCRCIRIEALSLSFNLSLRFGPLGLIYPLVQTLHVNLLISVTFLEDERCAQPRSLVSDHMTTADGRLPRPSTVRRVSSLSPIFFYHIPFFPRLVFPSYLVDTGAVKACKAAHTRARFYSI